MQRPGLGQQRGSAQGLALNLRVQLSLDSCSEVLMVARRRQAFAHMPVLPAMSFKGDVQAGCVSWCRAVSLQTHACATMQPFISQHSCAQP